LIEVSAESNGGCDLVIGIGLNVNSSTKLKEHKTGPDKPWCSLFDILEQWTDRNQLIARLIVHLDQFLSLFQLKGFSAFMSQWNPIDYLQGQMITVSQPNGSLTGKANGVNEEGQLILMDDNGTMHILSSGETSLQNIACTRHVNS
jgi:BirA family biotin operon repressor/biotin-[acetyl-CoA-carboxylase] ligase